MATIVVTMATPERIISKSDRGRRPDDDRPDGRQPPGDRVLQLRRDGGALDILLVTDISPQEFVFGKLLGVVYNTKEYLIPPLLLAIYYAARGALTRMAGRGEAPPEMSPELVAPMAAVLAHEGCPVTGEIYAAGFGRFARIFIAQTEG